MRLLESILLLATIASATSMNFTIINGQIFTPGLAIVDAPQPFTPLGGDHLHVAIDVSGNGKLQLPPYADNASTKFNNITMFLYSYATGLNLTISNGTASAGDGSLGEIMAMEPGSTVKHVNWNWPDCLVGNGQPTGDSKRGQYNISVHQSFQLNATSFYTVFDLPISVTNEIQSSFSRVSCDSLNNNLVAFNSTEAAVLRPDQYPWTNGNGAQTTVNGQDGTGSGSGDGLGGTKPEATAEDGIGGAANVFINTWCIWITVGIWFLKLY